MYTCTRPGSGLLTTIAFAFCLTCSATWGQAPRSAQLIVAFTPGGPVDFVARLIAEPLGRELGHPVVVENRAGANGNIGAEYVAKGAPDGSVMFLSSVDRKSTRLNSSH